MAVLKRAGRIQALALTVLLALSCAPGFSFAADKASPAAPENYSLYYMCGSERIDLSTIGSKKYLFLPSGADTADIRLCLDAKDSGSRVCFEEPETGYTDSVDLSSVQSHNGIYEVSAVITDEDQSSVSDPLLIDIMVGKNIGTIYYHSSDPVRKGRRYIDRSKSSRGEGRAVAADAEGRIINSKEKNQVINDIHARGNSSFYDPKKSYQIKFDKKLSLADGAGEAKKWLLLAQYKDPLRVNDKTMKDIASVAAGSYEPARFSPKEEFVNLYYDGEYRGLYLLSEKIETGTSRLNIRDMEKLYEEADPAYGEAADTASDKNRYDNTYYYQKGLEDPEDAGEYGGYLIELNSMIGSEANWFRCRISRSLCAADIKSPEFGSRSSSEYISEYFQEFCNSLTAYGKGGKNAGQNPDTGLYYYDYCDLDSLADAFIINIIGSNCDAFTRSAFFYKDAGSKMYAGPVWDMDLTLGIGFSGRISPSRDMVSSMPIAKELLRIPGFRTRARDRYFSLYEPLLDAIAYGGDEADVRSLSDTLQFISSDLAMDWTVWPDRYISGKGSIQWPEDSGFDEIADDRISWLREHKDFLDSYFESMDRAHYHILGPAAAVSETSHRRKCESCDEIIEEDCIFHAVSLHDGTHRCRCEVCGNDGGIEDCQWIVASVITPSTCCSEGIAKYKCSKCGAVRKGTLPADQNAHSWDSGVISVNPGASGARARTYTCRLCGATRSESLPDDREAVSAGQDAPAKITISKCRASGKSAVIKWKPLKNVTGYQIRIMNKKTGKTVRSVDVRQTKALAGKKSISKTVRNLRKNRQYRIKIRAYKMSDGHALFGPWSGAKAVKLK